MTYFISIRKWIDKEFHYSERIRRTRFDADSQKHARKTAVGLAVTMAEGFESEEVKSDLIRTANRSAWKDGLHPEADYKFSRLDSDYFFEMKPVYEGEEGFEE